MIKSLMRFFVSLLAIFTLINPLFAIPSVEAKTTPRPAITLSPMVKKSTASICHAKGTRYYNQTKHFTPYTTLKECLKSGGRLPKR